MHTLVKMFSRLENSEKEVNYLVCFLLLVFYPFLLRFFWSPYEITTPQSPPQKKDNLMGDFLSLEL